LNIPFIVIFHELVMTYCHIVRQCLRNVYYNRYRNSTASIIKTFFQLLRPSRMTSQWRWQRKW
jgi:hypothetical protein